VGGSGIVCKEGSGGGRAACGEAVQCSKSANIKDQYKDPSCERFVNKPSVLELTADAGLDFSALTAPTVAEDKYTISFA